MDNISELRDSLNEYFNWNKARAGCFANMLVALILSRTVNLNKLACVVASNAQQSSRYRRIQRFFAKFTINYAQVAGFIFRLFFTAGGQWYLSMDRTNWCWGDSDINILTLAIVFKGTAIPIYWDLLDKRGSSDTQERITLIKKFIDQFGKESIKGILADREFVGEKWFTWLDSNNISFYIRIKNNVITTNSKGIEVDIKVLFYGLKAGEQRVLKGKRKVYKCKVFLAGLCLDNGELLIVATPDESVESIKIYGLRWEIETLFGCLKGRGFNFEDTHLTDIERIKKLMALLAIAFSWSHKTGEWRNEVKPIRLKKHGRAAVSLFRYGLDFICNAIASISFSSAPFYSALRNLFYEPVSTDSTVIA